MKCFKCEKDILPRYERAITSVWEMPAGAIILIGGDNYGSSKFDAMMDDVFVQLLICDDCLEQYPRLYRKIQIEHKRTVHEVL